MKKIFLHYVFSALFVGGVVLSAVSCADDDLMSGQGGAGDVLVGFNVNDVQTLSISGSGGTTRSVLSASLSDADFSGRRLEVQSNNKNDICLIETTVEGVNPVRDNPATRAEIKTAIDGDFSTTGLRSGAATSILTTPEWFHAEKTTSDGKLYTPIKWEWSLPHACFFSVFPSKENYTKMNIGKTSAAKGSPTVDFETESDVTKQVDFMTACTGHVHYATHGVSPTADLDFRHALTAIRFAVGQNLSWNKYIDRVELRNAVMKSKYTLSKEFSGAGATWDHSADVRGTAILSDIVVSTAYNPNTTVMGKPGDNYTFFMIPQVLTGKGVKAYIHFTDGTEINVDLKGEWKAGTTRTYKISQKHSDWTYVLTSTNPSRPANYDETTSQHYTITSYREKDGEQQAVSWKVIGYDANGDGNFSMSEKPDWLVGLSKNEGDGGVVAETGTAMLKKAEVKDLLFSRNEELKKAIPLGSAGNYYDLSTMGGHTARSTANCYVISAPGYYRIPLVYGNAIEKGKYNPNSYTCDVLSGSSSKDPHILRKFRDHNNQAITDPWIEKTNGRAYAGVNGAKIVWADKADLVHLTAGTAVISHDASGNAFLQFEVKTSDIKSGNAVIAATKNGTVVWSWHLWFTPQSALTPIEVTNHQGVKYNFTTEALGWTPTQWESTAYHTPRSVKFRVEQDLVNNGIKQYTDITITQNPGIIRRGYATLYQWGRKDAFPGVDETTLAQGSIKKEKVEAVNGNIFVNLIQNPQTFYVHSTLWDSGNASIEDYSYLNLWSAISHAETLSEDGNDAPVIKTVYDPCPVGFKMPASNAFTGFTDTGKSEGGTPTYMSNLNIDGITDPNKFKNNFGHDFWTNSNKDVTIYFPALGNRSYKDGTLRAVGIIGSFWSAVPGSISQGCGLFIYDTMVYPVQSYYRAGANGVRPVTE